MISVPPDVGRRHLVILLLLGVLALAVARPALAEPVVRLTGTQGAVSLLPMAYLLDPEGALSPAEASARLATTAASIADQVFSHGYVDDTIWIRVILEVDAAAADEQWYVALELSNFDRLDVYPSWLVDVTAPGAVPAFSLGDRVPEGRSVRSRFHIQELELAPGRHEILFGGRTSSTLTVPLRLWQPATLHAEEQGFLILQGFYLGISALLAAATAVLAIYLRQIIFLIFTINATSHGMVWMILNGVGPGYLWPEVGRNWEISSHGFVAMAIASIFAFSAMFLTGPRVPRFVRLTLWTVAGLAALLSISVFLTPRDFSLYMNRATSQIMLPTALALIVGTLIALVRGEPAARLLALAWSGLAAGAVLAMLRDAGIVPNNMITFSGPQLGSILEMLVFAFMLAQHIRHTQREKERLQSVALALSREQEAKLEKRVAQRTAELDAANRRLSAIVEAAPFPLLLEREHDDVVVFVNLRAAELFADAPDLAVHRGMPVQFVSAEERAGILAELQRDDVARSREVELRRADGSRFWVLLSAVRIEYDGQPVRLVAFNDISSMKAVEGYLRGAAAQERDARRIQRQFVEMISHEFRTPLAVIDGAAQNFVSMDVHDRNRVEKIRASVKRLLRLIDDCLVEERGRSGRLELNPERLDLADLVREAVEFARGAAPGHHFQVVLGEGIAAVHGDRRLLEIAVGNLLENAAKYSPVGSTVEVALQGNGGAQEIRVADEGPGVDPKERERVFGRYYRSENTVGVAGAGLGLHLVRLIAEAHEGWVNCTGRSAGGTVFALVLPVTEASAARSAGRLRS